jgi:hypothetical protein
METGKGGWETFQIAECGMEKGNLKTRRRGEVTYETVQTTGFTMGDAGFKVSSALSF